MATDSRTHNWTAVLDVVAIAGLTISLFAARPRQHPAALVG